MNALALLLSLGIVAGTVGFVVWRFMADQLAAECEQRDTEILRLTVELDEARAWAALVTATHSPFGPVRKYGLTVVDGGKS